MIERTFTGKPDIQSLATTDDKMVTLTLKPINISSQKKLMQVSRDGLASLLVNLRKELAGKTIDYTFSTPLEMRKLFDSILNDKYFHKAKKEELATVYASFTSDLDNIVEVCRHDIRLMMAWHYIIYRPTVLSTILETFLKSQPATEASSYSWYPTYFVDALFAPLSVVDTVFIKKFRNSSYTSYYYYSLLPQDRCKIAEEFFGSQAVQPEILEQLPDDSQLSTETFESNIPSDLLFLCGLKMTGNPLSANGTITEAKLKSISRSFLTPGFSHSREPFPISRLAFLVTAFFAADEGSVRNSKRKESLDMSKPADFARYIVETFPLKVAGARFAMFFPEFKGFTKSWAEYSYISEFTTLANSLIMPSAQGWMCTQNLVLRWMCADNKEIHRKSSLFGSNAIRKQRLRSASDNEELSQIDWFTEIDIPMLTRWIQFLSAMGLLELAYEKGEKPDLLDGIRFIRLTPLGRYAFGLDKKYEGCKAYESNSMDFDERNGILTLTDENSPFVFFLRQVSEPIGAKRFRFTADSIIKGCTDSSSLEQRIENLRNIIDVDKSERLSETVREAIGRSRCMTAPADKYSLHKLAKPLPELVEFLTSDKEIRENVLFAEKSVILVKFGFFNRLRTLCQRKGFLLD